MAGNHRSGRKPKPEALRILQGGRPTLKRDVPMTHGMPEVPEEIKGDALACGYFQRIGAHLDAHGIMALEYAESLAALAVVCADFARVREAFGKLHYQAFHTEKRAGRVVVAETPLLRRSNELAALRIRLLGDFGLTPAMATRVFGERTPSVPGKWDALGKR